MDTVIENVPLLLACDPLFKELLETYGAPGFPSRPPGFESLCRTILEQQVSLNSARASHHKLREVTGGIDANAVLLLTDEQFRACGISRQKTLYIREAASAVVSGELDFEAFPGMPAEEVRSRLIRIKGVGHWTVDIYMMFSLRSPDILPLGDIGILSAVKELTGLSTIEDILNYTQKWSPYRTTASFFLWHYYLEKRGRKFPH